MVDSLHFNKLEFKGVQLYGAGHYFLLFYFLILDITLVLQPQAMSQAPRVRQVLHLALPCEFFPRRQ